MEAKLYRLLTVIMFVLVFIIIKILFVDDIAKHYIFNQNPKVEGEVKINGHDYIEINFKGEMHIVHSPECTKCYEMYD